MSTATVTTTRSRPRLGRSRLASALVGGILLAVIVIVLASAVASTSYTLTNSVTIALINLIALMGLSMFSGNSGLLSFAHVGFMGLGAYTAGILVIPESVRAAALPDLPGWLAATSAGPVVAILAAGAVAAAVGVVTGLPVARLNGAPAVIATLGILMIIHVVLIAATSITRGSQSFYGVPRLAPFAVITFVAAGAVLLARVFRDTRLGLSLRASRDDELAAAAVGVAFRVKRYLTWVLAAALAGVAGGLYGFFLGAFSPRQFYLTLTLTLIAMLVVGGINTVSGAIVGVVGITFITEVLRRFENGFSFGSVQVPQIFGLTDIGLAVAILAAMYLRPSGVFASFEFDEWLRRRFRRSRTDAPGDMDWSTFRVSQPATLEAREVSKSYAGVQALASVSVSVETGEILGLIGANGSGKSTLVNVFSGVTRPDSGSVHLDGDDIGNLSPHRRCRDGLVRTFQSMRLFTSLTAHDNVVVASLQSGNADVVSALCSSTALDVQWDQLASTLSYGDQRRVEIARAMATTPRLLLLDEPAAGMNHDETTELSTTLRALVDATGIGILVIDHDMSLMRQLCDRLVVLDHGKVICEGSPAAVLADPDVALLYLGASAETSEQSTEAVVDDDSIPTKGG